MTIRLASALVALLVFYVLFLASTPSRAAEIDDPRGAALGATLPPLLDMARAMSPKVSAATLSAEAALARAGGSGSLPDPTFRVQLKDIDRASGSVLPQRINRIDYSIEQEFPLWGKRDLTRRIAGSTAKQVAADRDRIALELSAAVKLAFSQYYAAHQSLAITEDIRRTITLAADVAQKRYEQALGPQQDALMLRVEIADLETKTTRTAADQRRAAAKINTLLNRPTTMALAAPEQLPLPPAETVLQLTPLMERAQLRNPSLLAQQAVIASAYDTKSLAEKSWYPDVTLGLSVVDQSRRWQGYEAMVSLKLPFNATQRRAETSAAISEIGAAKNRREAAQAEIRGSLETALVSLDEAHKVSAILHENHIPQADFALKAALAGYQQGRVPLASVLDAARHALQNKLEHLAALVDEQRYLAEIEMLVGDTL